MGSAHAPPALGASGAPHPDPGRRALVLIPSHTAGAGWRRRAFLPQLWAPGGLTRPALPYHSSAGVAGRDQCSGPVWAVLGRAAPCGRAGRERTALNPLLGPAHRVTRRYSCGQTLVQLQACTPPWVHRAREAPAGLFTHAEHEFLEAVILNQEHRPLIDTCTAYVSKHADSWSHAGVLLLPAPIHILYLDNT